jgi:hypothetical protein
MTAYNPTAYRRSTRLYPDAYNRSIDLPALAAPQRYRRLHGNPVKRVGSDQMFRHVSCDPRPRDAALNVVYRTNRNTVSVRQLLVATRSPIDGKGKVFIQNFVSVPV